MNCANVTACLGLVVLIEFVNRLQKLNSSFTRGFLALPVGVGHEGRAFTLLVPLSCRMVFQPIEQRPLVVVPVKAPLLKRLSGHSESLFALTRALFSNCTIHFTIG